MPALREGDRRSVAGSPEIVEEPDNLGEVITACAVPVLVRVVAIGHL